MNSSAHSDQAHLERVEETLRTRYWCWKLYSPADGPATLLELLIQRLPHIAPTSWPARFDFGGVYVNGYEAVSDRTLPHPCKVEYYEPKFEISDASSIFPSFSSEYVVFSDEYIAVVYKPPRLSSMPAKEQRHYSLKLFLDRQFGTTVHMPSRLDVSAQGLVVVSISPAAHAGLQHAFEQRRVSKTYRFATQRVAPFDERSVDLRITVDPRHPVLRTTSLTEGQEALTIMNFSHNTTSEGHDVSVVTAQPVTGRTHQIRVHAASQGMPILGDNFYGGLAASYLHLASVALAFEHPVTKEQMSFTLPKHIAAAWINPPV